MTFEKKMCFQQAIFSNEASLKAFFKCFIGIFKNLAGHIQVLCGPHVARGQDFAQACSRVQNPKSQLVVPKMVKVLWCEVMKRINLNFPHLHLLTIHILMQEKQRVGFFSILTTKFCDVSNSSARVANPKRFLR